MKTACARLETIIRFSLEAIEESGLKHLEDLCCDHGKIGMGVLTEKEDVVVSFVDCSSAVCRKLVDYLKLNLNYPGRYEVITSTAEKLEKKRGLQNGAAAVSVIAGVGHHTAIAIMSDYLMPHLQAEGVVIISVHGGVFELRDFLIEQKLKVIKEALVKKGSHYYEILMVSKLKGELADRIIGEGQRMPEIIGKCEKPSDLLVSYYHKLMRYRPYQDRFRQIFPTLARPQSSP